MKKSCFKTIILLIFFGSIITTGYSRGKLHVESKVIKKEFDNVSSNSVISITNKFGQIEVLTWNKDKVLIEVEITVKNKSGNKSKKMLEEITIDFNSSNDLIEAVTKFEVKQGKTTINKNNQKEINYKIKMPATGNLKVRNSFGDVYVNHLLGKTDLLVKYGSFRAGKLMNQKNKIELHFSKSGSIDFVKDANLGLHYSDLEIIKSENLKVDLEFSNLEIGQLDVISGDSRYDKLQIKSVTEVRLKSQFSKISIGTVYKSILIDNAYGSFSIKQVDSGFERLNIVNQFASIKIGFAPKASFKITARIVFATMNYPNNWNINAVKSSTKSAYSGTINGGNGIVSIKSEYGGVKLFMN